MPWVGARNFFKHYCFVAKVIQGWINGERLLRLGEALIQGLESYVILVEVFRDLPSLLFVTLLVGEGENVLNVILNRERQRPL